MNIVLAVMLLLSLWGCRVRKSGVDGYMSLEQTTAINGIFVMFVFAGHFRQYITYGKYDMLFAFVNAKMGPIKVTTFLFFSGFGIMYSIMNKHGYLSRLPKRIFRVLLHFDMAILLYLIINTIIGRRYPVSDVLLSLTGWESIGNSNWYIFAILYLYLFTYLAGRICGENYHKIAAMVAIGCALYIFLTYIGGRPQHFYNTIFCYSAGVIYTVYYEQIKVALGSDRRNPIIATIIAFAAFALCYLLSLIIGNPMIKLALFELRYALFSVFAATASSFIIVGNPVLLWLGRHIFEIYILQRIPMMLLRGVFSNVYVYFVACVLATLVMTVIFRKIEDAVDARMGIAR
ncbi:MAG: acyltransferase family protein [Lachnospiraceae bacterium]|nr:acyltransferase family protein [Lachnospiraceae bacterium]